MSKPIVIAYHLTWTAYGFWLPNDPRGSMSKTIASDVIAELGELHNGRKRIQPAGWEVRDFRNRAEEVLKFPILRFMPADIDIIACAMSEVIHQQPQFTVRQKIERVRRNLERKNCEAASGQGKNYVKWRSVSCT